MDKARELLQQLRHTRGVTEEQFHGFLELCREAAVPEVTLYVPSARCEGWYEMFRIFVFSARPDIRDFVWCHLPGRGLLVCDARGNGQPLKACDPAADIFFDESLFEGGTNMTPPDREKLMKRSG